MNCRRCGAYWKEGNISSTINNCPICDNNFQKEPEHRGFDIITELLQFLIAQNGIGYWNNKKGLNGYLNDYFPDRIKERADISNLLDKEFGNKMIEWYKNMPPQDVIVQDIMSLGIQDRINEYTSGIMYLLGAIKIGGTNFIEPQYYEEYARNCSDIRYKILALEKALKYGADDEIALKLSEIQMNVDNVKGLRLLQELSEKGNVNALLKLAKITEQGIFIERDYKKVTEYLVRAEQKKSAEGIYQLGRLYLLGRGVPRNRQKAIELLEKASHENHEKANYQLYGIYYNSNCSLQQVALNKLQNSAKSGYVPAMYEFALHLLYGENVVENIPMAVSLLEACANNGMEEAEEKLCYIFSVGYKVEKDKFKALQWKNKLMGE